MNFKTKTKDTPSHKEEYAELKDLDLKSCKTWSLSLQLQSVLQLHCLEATVHKQGPIPFYTK